MKKRTFAGAAVVAVALGMGPGAFSGSAATCPAPDSESAGQDVAVAPNGTTLYWSGQPDGSTDGFIGVKGSTGYIEANGGTTQQGGTIGGATDNGAVSGQIAGDTASGPSICVNDVSAP